MQWLQNELSNIFLLLESNLRDFKKICEQPKNKYSLTHHALNVCKISLARLWNFKSFSIVVC